jgi:hypothetical protein
MKNKIPILTFFLLFVWIVEGFGQAATNASMNGHIKDDEDMDLPGAVIEAIHTPSGTKYGAVTRDNGRFTIPAMRVGGPYRVTVSFLGFETQVYEGISLSLGQSYVLNTTLAEEGVELAAVQVEAERSFSFNNERTGAATNIGKSALNELPTISRSVTDFTRLTPQSSGTSFAGQDAKAINFSVDGSLFNNAFGSSGIIPGAPTDSSPISLDAVEEIQVNIAPYDVTQGGFVGAGINVVTRSGDNEFKGSFFTNTRNESFVGTNSRGTEVVTSDFNVNQYGFRLGGPIIKNKLFFFVSGEFERRSDPNSPFIANAPGRTGNNVTRVQKEDMDNLRSFLIDNYQYDPGRYEDYNLNTTSDKLLAKINWNINQNHQLSVRFNMLESVRERPVARTSLGFGGRNLNLFSLNFENSNYELFGNIYSGILELNSTFSNKASNNLIIGYTKQQDFRTWPGGDFPMVDILEDGRNYISFGTDILSPNRALDTDIFQFSNNTNFYLNNHTITAGVSLEAYRFGYTFTPSYFGQFVYNSLDDFYRDARDGESVELRRYQRTFSGFEDRRVPTAVTEAYIASAYVQDAINVTEDLKLTVGLRMDVPFFGQTAERNLAVEDLTFLRPNGVQLPIRTDRLPEPQYMFSPRMGFNWDVNGQKTFQIRGGTGLFTGRPIYINISNMINSNGILLGQIREDNTTNFPFNPDVTAYIPESGGLPETYDIAYIEPNFRNPQVWRSNIGVDKDLFAGIVGTFEAIYTRQITDIQFYDSNLTPSGRNMAGPDNRPLYGFSDEANRINQNISDATVLTNTDQGYSYFLTAQLQRSFRGGFYAMAAYTYGKSKNIVDGNTQHYLSYTNIHSVRGGNYPDLGYSLDDRRNRFISSVSYRKEYGKNMASRVSLFMESANQGNFSYVYNGDANGDLIPGNDLIFVPTQQQLGEMIFAPLTVNGGATFTPEQQRDAFNRFIDQDGYLSTRRGQYAERQAVQFPMVSRLDFSFAQEFFIDVKGKRNTLQFRADIFNFTNFLNKNWGAGYTFVNDAPIRVVSIDPVTNVPTYQMNALGGRLPEETFTRTANIGDVWQLQLGVRYIFN